MGSFLLLIGLLGVYLNWGIIANFRFNKKLKIKIFVVAGIGLIVTLGGCTGKTNPILKLDDKTINTNAKGVAIIKGETDKNSKVTIDGKDVPVKGNHFSYKYTLKKGKQKKLKIVAVNKEKIERYKTVTVKPTKAFIASLDTKAKKQLTKVDNALKTAEKTPTQVNYDEAATLVASSSKEYNQYTKRLKTIKKHIPIYEALVQAEKTKSKTDYKQAATLVAQANLNKKNWKKRLATVKQAIEQKEQQEQLTAAATAAVVKAEQEPTNETLYNEAVTKVNSLPDTNKSLAERIGRVKEQLETHKAQQVAEAAKKAEAEQQAQAAKKQVEEEKRAQAEAAQQAEAARQAAPAAEPTTGETLLATRSGSKYHLRECGNGDYYPTTQEEINRRHLDPCQKCFP